MQSAEPWVALMIAWVVLVAYFALVESMIAWVAWVASTIVFAALIDLRFVPLVAPSVAPSVVPLAAVALAVAVPSKMNSWIAVPSIDLMMTAWVDLVGLIVPSFDSLAGL